MEVPLIVKATEKYGKEKLSIWFNDINREIDSPIKPYYYSYSSGLNVEAKRSSLNAIALSDYKEKKFYKYEFKTRKKLTNSRSKDTFEDNIPFTLRNRVDNPSLYTKFPNTKQLRFLFLDIEQDCPEGKPFPDYDDIITSISWCTNDRQIYSIYLKKETMSDKKLLLKFIEIYKKVKPDVIVVYNRTYDIPTLLYRCERNRISTSHFSKDNTKPYAGGKEDYSIGGVVIYDVLLSARADQSLTGKVVDRGLKEVSNHFKFKQERKPLTPRQITNLKGTKELVDYNKDDIRRLLLVFDIYWGNIEFNANDLKIPLNEAINLNTTGLGIITVGDEYKRLNIIADGTNYDRYPEIFQRKKREKWEPNYQGALVDIYRTGLFKPVYKIDYSSMYPTIMATFNLSPDTTTLLTYEPYQKEFKIEEHQNWYVYYIPDKYLNRTMVIQVSKKQGFLSDRVHKYLDERKEYKDKWKETGLNKYRSMSDNRKVKANGGVYGNMGASKHPFGFAPIAVATCGIGRECAQLLIDILNELYPKSVLEVDTDGVYYTTDNFDKGTVLSMFEKRLKERFKKDLDLSVDIDEYDAGYFYKSKNYILKKGKKIILHGVALTASSQTIMQKNLIKELAKAKIEGESTDDIIVKYLNLKFPLNWFAMNRKMGMPLWMYKNQNDLIPRLAKLAETKLGYKCEVGTQLYYVKTKTGYNLFDLVKKEDIDYNYYKEEINKIVEMFDIQSPVCTVDKWIKW